MWIVFNTRKEGFQTLLKPWQEAALRFVWSRGGEPVTTREVWTHILRGMRISYLLHDDIYVSYTLDKINLNPP